MMKQPFTAGMAYEQLSGMGKRAPAHPLPMFGDTVGALARAPSETLRVTWLGHSTVLIEIDGVRLLTDPVFGERASPVSFAGPRRFHQVPLSLAELGRIDAVVLSHDHYDHLCAPTVRALAAGAVAGFSGGFVTALGVGAHLEKLGVMPEHITELDWGDGHTVTGAVGATVDVVAVPSCSTSTTVPSQSRRRTTIGSTVGKALPLRFARCARAGSSVSGQPTAIGASHAASNEPASTSKQSTCAPAARAAGACTWCGWASATTSPRAGRRASVCQARPRTDGAR